jgi:hypothetical protein
VPGRATPDSLLLAAFSVVSFLVALMLVRVELPSRARRRPRQR